MSRPLGRSAYAGLLFAVLGLLAWASGRPFVFPSLGPSAFVLAMEGRGERVRPYRVVGGHLVGAVAGIIAYALLAAGASLASVPPPFSPAGLRLAASGTLSVALTSGGMVLTDTVHPPACATTLIVSLGVLSTPVGVVVIVASVAVLVGVHAGARSMAERLADEEHTDGRDGGPRTNTFAPSLVVPGDRGEDEPMSDTSHDHGADPVTDRVHDNSWSANLELPEHADDEARVVEGAIEAIEHTAPGNHVNLVTHGDHGHPSGYLYPALASRFDDSVEWEYVEQCGCGGHVTRVHVERPDGG